MLLQVPVIPADSDDSASDLVYGSFGSDTIFLFIGAFMIAQAMRTHGLDRRFAFRVLSLPGVAKSTYRLIIAFGAIAALISAFISNTATAAMLLPIGLGMMGALGDLVSDQSDEHTDASRLRFGTALMLMISYGAGVGGLLTPIGTPPNLIGIAFIESETGTTITFFSLGDDGAADLPADVRRPLRDPDPAQQAGGAPDLRRRGVRPAQRAELGPLTQGRENTLVVFGVAVFLWVLPGFVALFAGDESDAYAWITARLDEGTVAIIAAVLLFLLPVDWERRRFTMNWNEAVKIDWGTVILFGSRHRARHAALGTGLAETIGTGIADTLGVTSLVAVSAVAALIAIVISETTSNTASATIVVPIVIPIAAAAGLDPVIPALCAVFGASFGFMMPVSTPQNAVVYGSGMIPITKMVRSGIVFDILGILLIVALIPLMASLVGIV